MSTRSTDAPGTRWRELGPAIGVGLVVAVVETLLALHFATSSDEFTTMHYVHLGSLSAVWRSYRAIHDTLPPAFYFLDWIATRLTGATLAGARVVSVVAWSLGSAGLVWLVRRTGLVASITAGLVPTATTLTSLGFRARPYGVELLLIVAVLLAWQRCRRRPDDSWGVVLLALLAALAVAIHYSVVAMVVVLAALEVLDRAAPPRRWVRIAGLGAGLVPILVSLPLIVKAASDQNPYGPLTSVTDAPAFYVSVFLSLIPALVVAAFVLVARRGRLRPTGLDRIDLIAAGAIFAFVPAMWLAAMAVTSGVWYHRYGLPAVVAAAVLAAAGVHLLGGRTVAGGIVAAAVVLCLPIAAWRVQRETPTASAAAHLGATLRIPERGAIVATSTYELSLLVSSGDNRPAIRAARLASSLPDPLLPGRAVGFGRVHAMACAAPLGLVGDPATIRAALTAARLRPVATVGSTVYWDGGNRRRVDHVRVAAPDCG